MAWRLDEAVEHGLIDNTVEGITTGKIWLAGRDEPLILSLNGDCWRDLAGTVLEFENPSPQPNAEASSLDTEQTGIVGDITASRKARIPDISEEEISEYYQQDREIPCKWRNILYLEWFSEINGRVLIESAGYTLTVSGREWDMDEDLEEAQKLANLSAMRDFLAQVIRRTESEDYSEKSHSTSGKVELNEFEWEERLKESDRLTDAYQEVLEKYVDDEDSERKEAFVMGWDGLLGAMADREEGVDDESGYDDFDDDDDEDDFADDWQLADDDDDDDEEDDEENEEWLHNSHPLQTQARELSIRSFELMGRDGDAESPTQRVVSNLVLVAAKLAGVLHDDGDDFTPENGFVLAVLKRCLNWVQEAINACDEVLAKEADPDQVAAVEHLKSDAFSIRDSIIELRRELKQS